jgi:hypothetical protein
LPRGAFGTAVAQHHPVVVNTKKGAHAMRSAYYSNELGSWVRMERQADGEYCHTSGYETRAEAMGVPSWIETE